MHIEGLDVDECPKFLSKKQIKGNHSVYFPMLDIRLTFQFEGTILYLPTRKQLKVELKESEGKYMLLTPNTPEWYSHMTIYRNQEHVMMYYKGHIK